MAHVAIPVSADLRYLAEIRLREAQVLLRAGEFSGAYYLAGYAVECGLKALLTNELDSFRMPQKSEVTKAHTHDVQELAKQCGLMPTSDKSVRVEWSIVSAWSEGSRYETHLAPRAREMVEAADAVLNWLALKW